MNKLIDSQDEQPSATGDKSTETSPIFYLCPKCFETFEMAPTNHPHPMLRIDTTQFDIESRKPLMDRQGNLLSSAPRWFLEATGMISYRRPTTGALAA